VTGLAPLGGGARRSAGVAAFVFVRCARRRCGRVNVYT